METNKSRRLIALVLALFIITLGLGSFLIIRNQDEPERQTQDSQKLNFYEFSQLIARRDYDTLALLLGAKDLKPVLKKFAIAKPGSKPKVTFVNPDEYDYMGEMSEPIVNESGFRLLINFDNQNTGSEIILSGRENLQTKSWWSGIHQLRIGYNNNNEWYLNIHNGRQENSVYYLTINKIKPRITFILEFVDTNGSRILIKDTSGQELAVVDISANKDLKMPSGLFPYSDLKVGVNLPPQGKLIINKILYYSFIAN